jgi:predicted nucleic acid-binding protein
VLETGWVLRAAYRLPPDRICEGLRALFGLPGLTVEDLDQVLRALSAHEQGLDLADALHHAASGRAGALATFDRTFASRAAAIGLVPVVREP